MKGGEGKSSFKIPPNVHRGRRRADGYVNGSHNEDESGSSRVRQSRHVAHRRDPSFSRGSRSRYEDSRERSHRPVGASRRYRRDPLPGKRWTDRSSASNPRSSTSLTSSTSLLPIDEILRRLTQDRAKAIALASQPHVTRLVHLLAMEQEGEAVDTQELSGLLNSVSAELIALDEPPPPSPHQARFLPPSALQNLQSSGDDVVQSYSRLSTERTSHMIERRSMRNPLPMSTDSPLSPDEYIPLPSNGTTRRMPATETSTLSSPICVTPDVQKLYRLSESQSIQNIEDGGADIPILINRANQSYVHTVRRSRGFVGPSTPFALRKNKILPQTTSQKNVDEKVLSSVEWKVDPPVPSGLTTWFNPVVPAHTVYQKVFVDGLVPHEAGMLIELLLTLQHTSRGHQDAVRQLETACVLTRSKCSDFSVPLGSLRRLHDVRSLQCFECGLRFETSTAKRLHLEAHFTQQGRFKLHNLSIPRGDECSAFSSLESWIDKSIQSYPWTVRKLLSCLPSSSPSTETQQQQSDPTSLAPLVTAETPESPSYDEMRGVDDQQSSWSSVMLGKSLWDLLSPSEGSSPSPISSSSPPGGRRELKPVDVASKMFCSICGEDFSPLRWSNCLGDWGCTDIEILVHQNSTSQSMCAICEPEKEGWSGQDSPFAGVVPLDVLGSVLNSSARWRKKINRRWRRKFPPEVSAVHRICFYNQLVAGGKRRDPSSRRKILPLLTKRVRCSETAEPPSTSCRKRF